MKWTGLGKIFDPAIHGNLAGAVGFAQGPQALVCDDFIRIYYSTRFSDAPGMFVSDVAYVDMTPDLGRVIRVADKPVITRGALGCFDEHGIFPMNVIRRDGEVWAYTCGWSRRAAVSVDTAIGLAVSRDGGETFQRIGPGPVLAAAPTEPFLVGDGFVGLFSGVFHMWYIFGVSWKTFPGSSVPERIYKIGHALSEDGVQWVRNREGSPLIPDRLGVDECQAMPSVISIGGQYHMFFCYREANGFRTDPSRGYRIGHACSEDLIVWTRDDDSIPLEKSTDGWDSDMRCYPHVFSNKGATYLLYNGNEFGRGGLGAAILET